MIIEDNVLFRESLIDTLTSRFSDLTTIEIETEQAAYHSAETKLPDLIFMDVSFSSTAFTDKNGPDKNGSDTSRPDKNTPNINGMDITRTLKQRHPQVPIVILTSYDLPEYREAALASGADHFISKDTAGEALLILVEDILYKKS
jgi:DNA-binding NarL/FixJ family response regulator